MRCDSRGSWGELAPSAREASQKVTQEGLQQLAGVGPGEILAGKYRVEYVLGAGGMGAVVAAHHLQLDRKVAIKFLLPAMLVDQDAVARFAREARNAVRITSDHVVRVLDVGSLENGAPYMVMEYLEGSDLSAILRQRGPLPVKEAIDFVLQAMEAIAEAHTLGIVHRDLKPANLFCGRAADRRAHIKVLDFGISKGGGSAGISAGLTATAAMMGSPFYMSPEQMDSAQTVDARTDIWALGVVLFELLTGKVPFSGETIPEVSIKIATRPPPPLQSLRPEAPEGLARVILTCLEKSRERRYRNAAELAAALLPFGSARAKSSVERISDTMQTEERSATMTAGQAPIAPGAATVKAPIETMSALGRTTRNSPVGTAVIGLFVGVGVLALAGGVAVLHARSGDSQPANGNPSTKPSAGAPGEATSSPFATAAKVEPALGVEAATARPVATGVAVALRTCEPESKRCSGSTPQSCSAAGQWQDAMPCALSQTCREGSCFDTRTSHAVVPSVPARRDASAPIASTSAKPDCDPNYYLDALGRKRFKPECFGVPTQGSPAP